ncbi:Caleosin [Mycena vitilis]|nr:Caleosin [Mycena vitilis]
MQPRATPSPPGNRPKTLQSHVAFFDADQDGIIWPLDTYKGCREIGFGIILAAISAMIIHSAFSWVTFGTLLPDPFLRIRVSNIDRALHGSDSGSYETGGKFDESRFNHVFGLYSTPPHTHLTFWEGVSMLRGLRNIYDPFGWFAAACDWGATYLLLWPADGRVTKQDVHDILDGSLFPKLAQRTHIQRHRNANANGNANGSAKKSHAQ